VLKNKTILTAAAALLAATLAATATLAFRNLGTWLVVSGPPTHKADLLFLLGRGTRTG